MFRFVLSYTHYTLFCIVILEVFLISLCSSDNGAGLLDAARLDRLFPSDTKVDLKSEGPSTDLNYFYPHLQRAKHIVVVTGAEISEESGVPLEHEVKEMWRDHDVMTILQQKTFRRFPSIVWEYLTYKRGVLLTKKPNGAHYALAQFEKQLKQNDSSKTFTIITSNQDGFHTAAGSQNVVEVDGNLLETRCVICGHVELNKNNPICESLRGRGDPTLKEDQPPIPLSDLPHCKMPGCRGLLRPNILWWGEEFNNASRRGAEQASEKADLAIMIGMSYILYPTCILSPYFKQKGVIVAEINVNPTTLFKNEHDFYFQGLPSQVIPKVLNFSKLDEHFEEMYDEPEKYLSF